MGQKRMTVKNDLLFKKIFGSPANKRILKGLLTDSLDIQIESLEIQNPFNIQTFRDAHKQNRLLYTSVDISAKIQGGISIIIEFQLQSRRFFPERLLYYWGERFNANYAQTEKEDVKYRSLKPVFVISILDYVMFPDDQDLRRTFHIYDAEHQHILRSKDGTSLMQMVFIELPKIKGNVPPKLVDWVDCFVLGLVQETAKTYIKDVIKLVDEVAIRKGEIKQMIDVIEKAREDEKAIRGYAEEVAREEAREETIEEVALNFKKMGAPLEQIQQATGLSIERIKEL